MPAGAMWIFLALAGTDCERFWRHLPLPLRTFLLDVRRRFHERMDSAEALHPCVACFTLPQWSHALPREGLQSRRVVYFLAGGRDDVFGRGSDADFVLRLRRGRLKRPVRDWPCALEVLPPMPSVREPQA